jgi:hypothetical protein
MTKDLPSSTQETIEFFEDFIRKAEVIEFITKVRNSMGIPVDGMEYTKKDEEQLAQPIRAFFHVPESLIKQTGKSVRGDINRACATFLKKHNIESLVICDLLRLYIIFNKTIPAFFGADFPSDDFLAIDDFSLSVSCYSREDFSDLQKMYDNSKEQSEKYPLILYINPHTSQKQAIDFIKKNWSLVGTYANALPRLFKPVRKKKNRERDDFIYANRYLPRKKIMRLLYDKYTYLNVDYASIGKIISLERKKRENK